MMFIVYSCTQHDHNAQYDSFIHHAQHDNSSLVNIILKVYCLSINYHLYIIDIYYFIKLCINQLCTNQRQSNIFDITPIVRKFACESMNGSKVTIIST